MYVQGKSCLSRADGCNRILDVNDMTVVLDSSAWSLA